MPDGCVLLLLCDLLYGGFAITGSPKRKCLYKHTKEPSPRSKTYRCPQLFSDSSLLADLVFTQFDHKFIVGRLRISMLICLIFNMFIWTLIFFWFFQVYSNSLQEKLVKIMQNRSLLALWIGGWYSNKPIPSMGDKIPIMLLSSESASQWTRPASALQCIARKTKSAADKTCYESKTSLTWFQVFNHD